jgi:hypothetical protein
MTPGSGPVGLGPVRRCCYLGSKRELRLGICFVFRLFNVAPETTARFSHIDDQSRSLSPPNGRATIITLLFPMLRLPSMSTCDGRSLPEGPSRGGLRAHRGPRSWTRSIRWYPAQNVAALGQALHRRPVGPPPGRPGRRVAGQQIIGRLPLAHPHRRLPLADRHRPGTRPGVALRDRVAAGHRSRSCAAIGSPTVRWSRSRSSSTVISPRPAEPTPSPRRGRPAGEPRC